MTRSDSALWRLGIVSLAAVGMLAGCSPKDAAEQDVLGMMVTADPAVVELRIHINGFNAATPPGPEIEVGKAITLSFLISNHDTADITDVVVTDSELGAATCPFTYVHADSFMTCQIQSTAVAGQHSTTGRLRAKRSDSSDVEATVPTNYLGVAPAQISCNAGGPYAAECQGAAATIQFGARRSQYSEDSGSSIGITPSTGNCKAFDGDGGVPRRG